MVRNKYKIIAVTNGAYPYGGASTNRHLSYLKGLVELGNSAEILITSPSKNQPEKSNKNKGEYNGVKYLYTSNTTHYTENKYIRIIKKFTGTYNTLKRTKKIIRESKHKTILLILTTDVFEITPFLLFAKRNNIKIFHERTEHPFVNVTNSKLSRYLVKLYLKLLIPKFTGIFVITDFLKSYLLNYTKNEKKIRVIPMTVEPERFLNKEKDHTIPYIAYCGSMYTDKDGVPILLDAFEKIAEKYNDIKLYLIGDNSNKKKFKHISDKIDSLKAKERIVCTGLITRDEMPDYLINAKLLVLSRPDNLQAKAGFPTKLGEYLASANPVIITGVGEIPNYLTDGVNAYIAEPDNCESFADKICEALGNYEKAIEIGKAGQLLTKTVFNYNTQSENIYSFFNSI